MINDKIVELRAWLVQEVFEDLATTHPDAHTLKHSRPRDGEKRLEAFLEMAKEDAREILRAALSDENPKPTHGTLNNELVSEFRDRLDSLGLTSTAVLDLWDRESPAPPRRNRLRFDASEPWTHPPDLSWLYDGTRTRKEIVEHALFLRGFLDISEVWKALHETDWKRQAEELGRVFDEAGLDKFRVFDIEDLVSDELAEEDFRKFIHGIITFGPEARAETVSTWLTWYVFQKGVETELPRAFDHVCPEGLDAGIAMWVRVFIASGISTTFSCQGHRAGQSPNIDFSSPWDTLMAQWVLLEEGAGSGFNRIGSRKLTFDSRDAFSKKHYDSAMKIYQKRDSIRATRNEVAKRVHKWIFTQTEVPTEREIFAQFESELAHPFRSLLTR